MQYYYLVAGLTEYPFDIEAAAAGGLKIDVPEIKRTILGELAPADRRAVELLYTYYDILNIVGYVKRTGLPFNVLGNLSHKEVALLVDRTVEGEGEGTLLPEELAAREEELAVPAAIRAVVERFRGGQAEEGAGELAPLSVEDLERELFLNFYRVCEGTARQLGWPAEVRARMIVEERQELREAYVSGLAQDFGMRDRFPYTEEVLQVLETEDFVERERRMDALRVRMADDLAEQDYFGGGRGMDYLIRLNILYRWTALEAGRGREEFRELVAGLTEAEAIGRATARR